MTGPFISDFLYVLATIVTVLIAFYGVTKPSSDYWAQRSWFQAIVLVVFPISLNAEMHEASLAFIHVICCMILARIVRTFFLHVGIIKRKPRII